MSSSFLPENIGPTTTSIHPILPFTMSTRWPPGHRIAHCSVKIQTARTQSKSKPAAKEAVIYFTWRLPRPTLEILRVNRAVEKRRERVDHRDPKSILPRN